MIIIDSYAGNKQYASLDELLSCQHRGEGSFEKYWYRNQQQLEYLIKDLAYSPSYRQFIRENEAETVVKRLVEEASILKQMTSIPSLLRFVKNMKENMGNHTIVRIPASYSICFKGVTYEGVNGLMKANKCDDSDICVQYERFPCFDSHDYAHESRYNRYFWFCRKDPSVWEAVRNLGIYSIKEDLPDIALPMVQYKDESGSMLVAYKDNELRYGYKIDENMKTNIYNIVILDESGSMEMIKRQAMNGYNETVQTIKEAQARYTETQQHFVTLVSFNSSDIKTICDKVPVEQAQELNEKTYLPNCGTPLYDAMGMTLSKFRYSIGENTDNKVLVTIITDGKENSSRGYSRTMIKKIVDELKEKGWVFTYIGANQDVDVETVAAALSITNAMAFEADTKGTQAMFKKERESRNRFFCRIAENESPESLQQNFFEEDDTP